MGRAASPTAFELWGSPSVGVSDADPPSRQTTFPPVPAPVVRRARGGYALRARHARERVCARVTLPLAVAEVDIVEDRLVLAVLRAHPLADLDAVQVAARAGLAPSVVAPALDRLVRGGVARELVAAGRLRYGLT